MVEALQKDVTRFASKHELVDRNRADGCVKDVEGVVRLLDERSNVPITSQKRESIGPPCLAPQSQPRG